MKHLKKPRASFWWVALGITLLLAAATLTGYNLIQDRHGAETARRALSAMQEMLPQAPESQMPTDESDLYAEYTQPEDEAEVLLEIDGNTYLGYLSIPALDLELPVLSDWSYPNLRIAPCRYGGTVAGGDLMIAAHNYSSHFGGIGGLTFGDTIYFTDGRGVVHKYQVTQSQLIAGHDAPAMEADADTWDLTLFTCTWSGQSRVTVRAVLVTK